MGVPSQRAGPYVHPRGSARSAVCAAIWRSDRLVLFARSANREAAVEEKNRGARCDAADSNAGCLQRQCIRSRRLVGRNALAGPEVPVLHLPRQRHGPPDSRWPAGLEILPCAGAETNGPDQAWYSAIRAIWRGGMGFTNTRRKTWRDVHRHWRQLLFPRNTSERRDRIA